MTNRSLPPPPTNQVRDTASLMVLVDSLSRTHPEKVRIQFFADGEHILNSGNTVSQRSSSSSQRGGARGPEISAQPTGDDVDQVMCRWVMRTENAKRCGGEVELQMTGK
jgi:hypothetical protein